LKEFVQVFKPFKNPVETLREPIWNSLETLWKPVGKKMYMYAIFSKKFYSILVGVLK